MDLSTESLFQRAPLPQVYQDAAGDAAPGAAEGAWPGPDSHNVAYLQLNNCNNAGAPAAAAQLPSAELKMAPTPEYSEFVADKKDIVARILVTITGVSKVERTQSQCRKSNLVLNRVTAAPEIEGHAEHPMRAVLICDRSSSMGHQKRMELLKETLEEVIEDGSLGAKDEMAILAFNDDTQLVQPMGAMTPENKAKALAAMKDMTTERGTDIYKAIASATAMLPARECLRQFITTRAVSFNSSSSVLNLMMQLPKLALLKTSLSFSPTAIMRLASLVQSSWRR
jgi:hypothetical protein